MSASTSLAHAVVDLCESDDEDWNVAKRPINLLSDDDDEQSFVEVVGEKRPRQRGIKAPMEDTVEIIRTVQKSPLLQVLEVFPDVEDAHANRLLEQHSLHAHTVLQLLAEGSYPKKSTKRPKNHSGAAIQINGTTWKYDYTSPSSFETTAEYRKQAKQLLQQDFRFLTVRVIDSHMSRSNHHYAVCHDRIVGAILGKSQTEEDEYQKFQKYQHIQTFGLALNYNQIKALEPSSSSLWATHLSQPRASTKVQLTNEILQEELNFVQRRNADLKARMDLYQQRQAARAQAEATNSMVECHCCYSDTAPDELVQCLGGDLFCVECLSKFAETQIFANGGNFGIHPITKQPATELLCMAGCGAGFSLSILEKALSKSLLQKYNEIQFRSAVEKVHMDDLVSCPKCGFQAVLPITEMILRCPVMSCAHESCRKCGEEPHIPLRCDEVEKKEETSGRLRVEEAISKAKIRSCPKCNKKFVKETGCNKMRCACGTNSCYICRIEIPDTLGYRHFCQQAHCTHKTCGLCQLYSKADEDDERAMREAGLQAAEEVRERSLLTEANGEVAINVDSILKAGR